MTNFQRQGSTSNTNVGIDFEEVARNVLERYGIEISRNFQVEIGVSQRKKGRAFDLGSSSPPVLVECKSHTWTASGNLPSAKLTVWNESMYFFFLAPTRYRKIFFILRDENPRTGESLAEYYLRTRFHLIPYGVEFWELDNITGKVAVSDLTK